MNIFVTSPDPWECARVLPDKHIVKMPLETCQMLSIVASKKWGHGFGDILRADGKPYSTEKGAFRNTPALCGQTLLSTTGSGYLLMVLLYVKSILYATARSTPATRPF